MKGTVRPAHSSKQGVYLPVGWVGVCESVVLSLPRSVTLIVAIILLMENGQLKSNIKV